MPTHTLASCPKIKKGLLAQVSILGPLGYEPNTLPLRQRAYDILVKAKVGLCTQTN